MGAIAMSMREDLKCYTHSTQFRAATVLVVLCCILEVQSNTVTTAFCYGGSNCTGSCTVGQQQGGDCVLQEHEGRMTSTKWTCNGTNVFYETFELDTCQAARRISLKTFVSGMCYSDAVTGGGYSYSCDVDDTADQENRDGNCTATAGGCSKACHKIFQFDAPNCSCGIMQCTDNAVTACRNPSCCACCLGSCFEGNWQKAGYTSEKECCSAKPECCPK